jgi:hypothetical protein
MSTDNYKPSLTEAALKSRRAIVMGIGGGGDVIQAIPIANYLSLLGVEEIYVGGVGCQWWAPKGEALPNNWARVCGPTILDVSRMENVDLWAPMVVGVRADSHFNGQRPAEAVLRDSLPWDVFIAGLTQGVVGLRDSLQQVINDREIDLFVGVDVGSDSWHRGDEAMPASSSLVDFMSLSAMIQLDCHVIFGFSGYGCDAEMQLEELEERVAKAMQAGGYLGAYGITQRDAAQMLAACEAHYDPIEHWAPRAARGEIGLKYLAVVSPWGRVARVTPHAATFMFFDPHVVVNEVSTGVRALMRTQSLSEAEQIFRDELGQFPETQAKYVVNYLREE